MTSRLYLADSSALAYWLSPRPLLLDQAFKTLPNYMSYLDGVLQLPEPIAHSGDCCRLNTDEAAALRRYLGIWPPFHLMRQTGRKPAHSLLQVEHAHPAAVPQNAFIPLSARIAVPTPEFALLQMMDSLNDLEAIVLCSLFCSIFCFDCTTQGGTLPRRKLTSRERLSAFLHQCESADARNPPGIERLRHALARTVENAASPAELELALRMGLPLKMDGYGFGKLVLNHRVGTTLEGGRTGSRYCDFYIPSAKLAIEYHSDAEHFSNSQHKRDAARSNELLAAGQSEFILTSRELMDASAMDIAALHIGKRLDVRLFPKGTEAQHRREELRKAIHAALALFSKLGR